MNMIYIIAAIPLFIWGWPHLQMVRSNREANERLRQTLEKNAALEREMLEASWVP